MMQEQHKQATELTENIMRAYYCNRDIYFVLNQIAKDASWIGPGERERKYTFNEIRDYFIEGQDEIPSCDVSDVDLRATELSDSIYLVAGSMTVRTTKESKLLVEVEQRLSFVYRLVNGVFQVIHMHVSNPYGEMKSDEYFPNELGSQSNQYLQRLLREKTDVLDMITGNITGGLKGSNDDDTYSYFYVNEGLPRMLGFTYDEFMEKTGGTAVGAVYPPDLPNALADCARCFSEGPTYATEYRMEKKDGSLIWVLDSGRKALNSEGVIKINSIVTDITPLKQVLFELEIERERYHIALKNINGSMCEYNISNDLFTVYYQIERGKVIEIEKLSFPNFSKLTNLPIHSDEYRQFLALCKGQQIGSMELRTRFLDQNSGWRWEQFSCSVITDNNGIPVRSIGMLKDITEDKRKNLILLNQAMRDGLTQLLNQTAAKKAIQEYLASECSSHSALLIIDIDRFKVVNDSNGHLYGNEVLMKMARILEGAVGIDDIVGRTGGDEFIILVKDVTKEVIAAKAQEIICLAHKIGEDINFPISCSIGIACQTVETQEESFEHFFNRADKALYSAKDKGRNQWIMNETSDY